MRQRKSWIAILLLALLLGGCSSRSPQETADAAPDEVPQVEPKGKVYYTYFDTVSYVYDYAGDSAERFDDRSAEVSHILSEYHQLFDIYHEYSGINNLCTINKAAGGDALEVDPRLIDFLLCARDMYELTDGEMNIMLGPVLRLWHDCREAAEANPSGADIPSAEALEEAYRMRFGRNLTLERLSEAVIAPLCPDRGECVNYDPNLAASTYLENDLEMLNRIK